MKTNKLSIKVATAICSSEKWTLNEFIQNAKPNEYFSFTHHNFFYSYPEWGKKWKGEKTCQFHRVETFCTYCSSRPERNYAGVGTIYMLRNELTLMCDLHLEKFRQFKVTAEKIQLNQLSLF